MWQASILQFIDKAFAANVVKPYGTTSYMPKYRDFNFRQVDSASLNARVKFCNTHKLFIAQRSCRWYGGEGSFINPLQTVKSYYDFI